MKTITKNIALCEVYSNLKATAFFKDVAPVIGAGLLEIIPRHASAIGIIAGVTQILADLKINIRQCITEDPQFSLHPKLFIITEKPIPMKALKKIKAVTGVKSVTAY